MQIFLPMNKKQSYQTEMTKHLSKFSTASEWSDFIGLFTTLESIINRYNPEHNPQYLVCLPALVKRLTQGLNPVLPNGVHMRALGVYSTIFQICLNKTPYLKKEPKNEEEEEEECTKGLEFLLTNFNLLVTPLFSFGIHCRILVTREYISLFGKYIVPLAPLVPEFLTKILIGILPSLESEQSDFFDLSMKLATELYTAINTPDKDPSLSFYLSLYKVFIEYESLRTSVILFLNKHKQPDIHLNLEAFQIITKAYCVGLNTDSIFVVRNVLEMVNVEFPLKVMVPSDKDFPHSFNSEKTAPKPTVTYELQDNPILQVRDPIYQRVGSVNNNTVGNDEGSSNDNNNDTDNGNSNTMNVLNHLKQLTIKETKDELEKLNIQIKISLLKVLLKKESALNKKVYKIFDIKNDLNKTIKTLSYLLNDLESFYRCIAVITFRENCIDEIYDNFLIEALLLTKKTVENKIKTGSISMEEIQGFSIFTLAKVFVEMNVKGVFRVFNQQIQKDHNDLNKIQIDYNDLDKIQIDHEKVDINKSLTDNKLNTLVNLIAFLYNYFEIVNNYTVRTHFILTTREIIKKKLLIDTEVLDNYMDIFYSKSNNIITEDQTEEEIAAIDNYYLDIDNDAHVQNTDLVKYLSLEVYSLSNYNLVTVKKQYHEGTSLFYKGLSDVREEDGILVVDELHTFEDSSEASPEDCQIFFSGDIRFIQKYCRHFGMKNFNESFIEKLKEFLFVDYRHKYLATTVIYLDFNSPGSKTKRSLTNNSLNINNLKNNISTTDLKNNNKWSKFLEHIWNDFLVYQNPFYFIEYNSEDFLIDKIKEIYSTLNLVSLSKMAYLLEIAMHRERFVKVLYRYFILTKKAVNKISDCYVLEEMLSYYNILVQSINNPTEILKYTLIKTSKFDIRTQTKTEDNFIALNVNLDVIADLLDNNYTLKVIRNNSLVQCDNKAMGIKKLFTMVLSKVLKSMYLESFNNKDPKTFDDNQILTNDSSSSESDYSNNVISQGYNIHMTKSLLQKTLKIFHSLHSNNVEINLIDVNIKQIVLSYANDPLVVTYCLGMLDIQFILQNLMHFYKIVLYQINVKNIFSQNKYDEFYSTLVTEGQRIFLENLQHEQHDPINSSTFTQEQLTIFNSHNNGGRYDNGRDGGNISNNISNNTVKKDIGILIKVWKDSYLFIKTNPRISMKLYYQTLLDCFIEKAVEFSSIEYKNNTLVFNSDLTNLEVISTGNVFSSTYLTPFDTDFISKQEAPFKPSEEKSDSKEEEQEQPEEINKTFTGITCHYRNINVITEISTFSVLLIKDNLTLFAKSLPTDISIIPFFYSLNPRSKGTLFKEMIEYFNSYVLFLIYDDFDTKVVQPAVSSHGESHIDIERIRIKILSQLRLKYKDKLKEMDILCLLRVGLYKMPKNLFELVIYSIESNNYTFLMLKLLYCVILNNPSLGSIYVKALFDRLKGDISMFLMIYMSIISHTVPETSTSKSLVHIIVNDIYFYHKYSFGFYKSRKKLSILFADHFIENLKEENFFTFSVDLKAEVFRFLSPYINIQHLMADLLNSLNASFFGPNMHHKIYKIRRIGFIVCSLEYGKFNKFSDRLAAMIFSLIDNCLEIKIELYRLLRVLLLKMDSSLLKDIYPVILEDMHNCISRDNIPFKLIFAIISCIDVSLFTASKEFIFDSVLDRYHQNSNKSNINVTTVNDMKIKCWFNYGHRTVEQMHSYSGSAVSYYRLVANLMREKDFTNLENILIKGYEEKSSKKKI